ncbi:MAG: DUF1508 domain-containing protein [Bryobacter sp.]|jgi:uncharacterized protein YegP (UPF0339 family)|nr:DUF1508 domain-containing protein [Bryobacter sp.]
MKFVLWKDAAGEWRWTLRNARNGKIVADSAEGYTRRAAAIAMMRRINPDLPVEDAS